ncbi:MAG: hypothetical protein B6243_11820 [Anaerolineaceae bacterium 4572_5.2]|nr:MAG: hypothetical protein B6243_11820 [Anaerolineaceae bacterium 4572_5.2]
MSTDTQQHDPLNTQIPSAARIYDYTMGGTHNFEADRQAAEYMFSLVPSTRKWVKMLRAFLQEAAARLSEEGFTHFIDFASGLPTDDHIHAILPEDAKIIYSDIDPLTVSEAAGLVKDAPNVLYLNGDIRQAKELLNSPEAQEFLGGEKKVAFGLSGITVFLSPEEIAVLFQDLYDWAAPGSKLYITFETKEAGKMTPKMQQFIDMFAQAGSPFWLYTLEESLEMGKPWQVDEQGLVPLDEFLGLPEDYITEEDHEGVGLGFYAAIMEKK